jgi:hypothetical protein
LLHPSFSRRLPFKRPSVKPAGWLESTSAGRLLLGPEAKCLPTALRKKKVPAPRAWLIIGDLAGPENRPDLTGHSLSAGTVTTLYPPLSEAPHWGTVQGQWAELKVGGPAPAHRGIIRRQGPERKAESRSNPKWLPRAVPMKVPQVESRLFGKISPATVATSQNGPGPQWARVHWPAEH